MYVVSHLLMYQNTAELKDYENAVQSGKRPIQRAHPISAREAVARTMVFGIKSLGIGRSKFRERHGFEMMLLYGDTIRDLIDRGLLVDDGGSQNRVVSTILGLIGGVVGGIIGYMLFPGLSLRASMV